MRINSHLQKTSALIPQILANKRPPFGWRPVLVIFALALAAVELPLGQAVDRQHIGIQGHTEFVQTTPVGAQLAAKFITSSEARTGRITGGAITLLALRVGLGRAWTTYRRWSHVIIAGSLSVPTRSSRSWAWIFECASQANGADGVS